MPAPKGNRNGSVTWFPSPEEPKIAITSKVPKSIVDRLNELLGGQSRSAAIVEAIELLIELRGKKSTVIK